MTSISNCFILFNLVYYYFIVFSYLHNNKFVKKMFCFVFNSHFDIFIYIKLLLDMHALPRCVNTVRYGALV